MIHYISAIRGGVLGGGMPAGILTGEITSDIMQQLPLSLIPTFAVPFSIVLPIISLLQLRQMENNAAG